MAGSGDSLLNGRDVKLRRGIRRRKWELGDGVEGRRVLAGAVKFTLQVELDYFHIAQGHADVFVSHHLHERRQADAEAHHLCGEGVTKPVGVDVAGATRRSGHFR